MKKICLFVCMCLSMAFCAADEFNSSNYKTLTSDRFQLNPQHDLTRFLRKYAVMYDQFPEFKIVLSSGKISPEFIRGLDQLCSYAQQNKNKYAKRTAARQMMEFLILVKENLNLSLKFYNIYISYRGILGETHERVQNAITQSNSHMKSAASNWEYAGKCFLVMTE